MKIRLGIASIFLLVVFLLSSFYVFAAEKSAPGPGAATVDSVVGDMVGAPYNKAYGNPWAMHDEYPHGVPADYDWFGGAIPGAWMNTKNYDAITSWGQAYEVANGSPVTNVRIQVRNLYTYAYDGKKWVIIESAPDKIKGDNFTEDFTESASLSNVRSEKNNGGGISFTMAKGYNYHWWVDRWPRAKMPKNPKAIYTSVQIRLIPDKDPKVNLSKAKYIACTGLDYYKGIEEVANAPVQGAAITRMKLIKPNWQTFTMYITSHVPTSEGDYRKDILSRPLPPGVSNIKSTPQKPRPLPQPTKAPKPTPKPTPEPESTATITPTDPTWVTIDDNAADGWSWAGWKQYTDKPALNTTAHGGPGKGKSAKYTFKGTGFEYYSWKGPDGGKVEIIIDGVSKGEYSLVNSKDIYNVCIYSVSDLSNDKHTVQLIAKDDNWCMVDYIKIKPDGYLAVEGAETPLHVNLSKEGLVDWVHWGLGGGSDFNHKKGSTVQIGNFVKANSNESVIGFNDNSTTYSWSDGTPTDIASKTKTGIYTEGKNNGYNISIPASTALKTLKLYVGCWSSTGQLTFSLSDGSAPAYTTEISSTKGASINKVYTVTFKALKDDSVLRVKYIQKSGGEGNVTLQAATLH